MSDLSPVICEAFVLRMMRALSVHAATANPAEVSEGLQRLDAYRCAFRGERSDEEKEAAAARAMGLLSAWCMEPSPSNGD
jgi:hypothetical protein